MFSANPIQGTIPTAAPIQSSFLRAHRCPAICDANPADLKYRISGGIFYDRNDSLLASLLLNGTENLVARLNVYPGALVARHWFPGVFLGLGDSSDIFIGLTWRVVPLGISARFN